MLLQATIHMLAHRWMRPSPVKRVILLLPALPVDSHGPGRRVARARRLPVDLMERGKRGGGLLRARSSFPMEVSYGARRVKHQGQGRSHLSS